jgi:GT2 family glycosyltransferase
MRNLRTLWRRRRTRLLALVPFRNEMRYLPGLFENLEGQVDGVIALDDQSTDDSRSFVETQPLTRELLDVAPGTQGENEDSRNHRALIEAAWEHGADWLLGVDADERVERDFRSRALREIERAEAAGQDAMWVPWRELWDRPDRMRMDGIWGAKNSPRRSWSWRASTCRSSRWRRPGSPAAPTGR